MRSEVTQTGLKSQTALKSRSVYMAISQQATFQTIAKLLYMCKRYLLINTNLIDATQILRYWLFFQQQ